MNIISSGDSGLVLVLKVVCIDIYMLPNATQLPMRVRTVNENASNKHLSVNCQLSTVNESRAVKINDMIELN